MTRVDRRLYADGEAIPGTVYQVLGTIGSGGMGAVYDVEDRSIGKRYVLKALHPDLCDRKDLARRMTAEARTLGRLGHENIVEVVTAGVTADDPPRPFFVMERLSGETLRVVLRTKGRLALRHAYAIALDLLAALEHAHAHGVVHRDVKPDNLFLHHAQGRTVVKLLDFGIMRIVGRQGETAGRFVGTWRYAAPEQLRGEVPTPQTDLYAAALVMYEMIAGRGPFDDAGEPHQIGQAHLRREAPLLSLYRPVPPSLDALIGAALAKEPSKRPRDARAFAAELRRIASEETSSSGRRPEAADASELDDDAAHAPAVTRRFALPILVVGLAIVCVGTWLALRLTAPPDDPEPPRPPRRVEPASSQRDSRR